VGSPAGQEDMGPQLGVAAREQKEEGPGRLGEASEIPRREENCSWL